MYLHNMPPGTGTRVQLVDQSALQQGPDCFRCGQHLRACRSDNKTGLTTKLVDHIAAESDAGLLAQAGVPNLHLGINT